MSRAERPILYVMAAEPEYGPALRARIRPLMTGIGPVEAGVAVAAALAAMDERPTLVVCLGSAGSRRLPQGAVFQATALSYRDIDASPLGFPRGVTPLLDMPAVVPLGHRVPGVPGATLSTGGAVVSGSTYDAIDADMVDMETFAVWRACARFGVPMIGLRGISDGAAELRHLGDWTQHLHVVDANLAEALDRLHAAFEAGVLDLG